MMSEFTIEKGIPVSNPIGAGRKIKYPFDAMGIGDSFFTKDAKMKTMSHICNRHGKRLSCKFITRTVEGGVRVWRIE